MQEASVLRLSVAHEQGSTVLYAAGEIDITTAPQLREVLDHWGGVVVDLADVTFLESQGVAVLIAAQKRFAEHGGDLRLRKPQGSVRRALQLVGIDSWIDG